MSSREGLYVGVRERFPSRKELRALTDICDHEGLHKACAECQDRIEGILDILGPIVRDRVSQARWEESNMRWRIRISGVELTSKGVDSVTVSYPIYDVRTGRRLTVGPSTGAWGDTYGPMIWTGAEFHYLLSYIKNKMGFHVYANSHFGGINRTAHSPKSWHYVKDGQGRSLGADIGTYGDKNERNRIVNELIPLLDRLGVAWHYARDGHVPGHWDHIHIDVSNWGRKGGSAGTGYGYYATYKKRNIYTALGGSSYSTSTGTRYKKRTPRRVAIYTGSPGHAVRLVQNIAGVKRDGSYGPATIRAVKALQKRLGVRQDGSFGPATARAYLATVSPRKLGSKGRAVKLIQYIAGITKDGFYGPATKKAVKEMQTWAGLTPDGVFGPASRNKLVR